MTTVKLELSLIWLSFTSQAFSHVGCCILARNKTKSRPIQRTLKKKGPYLFSRKLNILDNFHLIWQHKENSHYKSSCIQCADSHWFTRCYFKYRVGNQGNSYAGIIKVTSFGYWLDVWRFFFNTRSTNQKRKKIAQKKIILLLIMVLLKSIPRHMYPAK